MLEPVIGLEIHVELATRTKLFCPCACQSGAAPNTLTCPICAGLPGAMPSLNRQAVLLALRAALVLGCRIHPLSSFDRKHYFYPDLPKGYQITQFYHPPFTGGALDFSLNGKEKRLNLTRIHIEEDAGKLTHGGGATLIDLNRCGVPLIEIVTEPELRSPEEAAAAFRQLHRLLTFAGVTQGRLNQGHMRCDVNLSLHEPGQPFGTRCEIKNLNSFSIVEKACRAEMLRQQAILEQGGQVECVTLRYDPALGTLPMRPKETQADYHFLPEPDLPPLYISEEWIQQTRAALPPLPPQRIAAWQQSRGIPPKQGELLCATPALAEAAQELFAPLTPEESRIAANLLCGTLLPLLEGMQGEEYPGGEAPAGKTCPADTAETGNACPTALATTESGNACPTAPVIFKTGNAYPTAPVISKTGNTCPAAPVTTESGNTCPAAPVTAETSTVCTTFPAVPGEAPRPFPLPIDMKKLREIAILQQNSVINATTAKALAALLPFDREVQSAPTMQAYCRAKGLEQLQDAGELAALAARVIEGEPALAAQYRAGKTKVLPALVGKAMGLCGGRANARALQQALAEKLQAPS